MSVSGEGGSLKWLAGVSCGVEAKVIPSIEVGEITLTTEADERLRISAKSIALSHPMHRFGDLSHMMLFVSRASGYPNTPRV